MEIFFIKNTLVFVAILLVMLIASFFFDRALCVGIVLLMALSGITFFVLYKLGFRDKKLYWLFIITLAIHLGATLFMHYDNFQPFSGGIGDYLVYQKSAVEASVSFRQGIFSIRKIALQHPDFYTAHCYPVLVGALYALTMPQEIIGLMLNVWLVALTVIFAYLTMLEIGGLNKNAFIVGVIIAVYPSYLFNSGLLLKDPLEICFIFLGLLFLAKVIKKCTWYHFLVFYLSIIVATHFRFYIGYALIATFIVSWFLFSQINLKRKIAYGVIFIILLGFIPELAVGQGYYGIYSLKKYFNVSTVNFYRQSAYNPAHYKTPTPPALAVSISPTTSVAPVVSVAPVTGLESTFLVENTPLGYLKSFVYIVLGPFPWQIKNARQAFALLETLPWYVLLIFVVSGAVVVVKKRIKVAMPLLIFSILVLILIAIFDNNFGLIVRIRIPAFISLLCVASLSPIAIKYTKNNANA